MLLHLIAGVATILALFLSKPENKYMAWVTVFLITLYSGWQAHSTYQTNKVKEARQRLIIERLSGETKNYLVLIRDMIFFSSDGWLPKTENEFFSSNTEDLICNYLNLDNNAPVIPRRKWRLWISQRSKNYEEFLDSVLFDYSELLDADLIKRISEVKKSPLLSALPDVAGYFYKVSEDISGRNRPPLLCPEREIEIIKGKDLKKINLLYEKIRDLDNQFKIDQNWKFLLMQSDNRWPKKLQGKDRFYPQ